MLAAQTHAIIGERQFCDVRHPQGLAAWLSYTTCQNVQLSLLAAGRGAVMCYHGEEGSEKLRGASIFSESGPYI